MQYLSAATTVNGIFQAGFAEGNAVQYTWSVPQNLGGLFALMGGDAAATAELEQLLQPHQRRPVAALRLGGQRARPLGRRGSSTTRAPRRPPSRRSARSPTTDYSHTPAGEPGNDDLGAMSSWYVWAALGLYPADPGNRQPGRGQPALPEATVAPRRRSKALRIEASGTPDTYVASATLALGGQAAQPLDRPWVPPTLVEKGGTLHFALASTPDEQWGAAPADAPPSYSTGAAPAVGFTSPSGAVQVGPGATTSVEVGAQSDSARATTVHWTVTAPSGVRIDPPPAGGRCRPRQPTAPTAGPPRRSPSLRRAAGLLRPPRGPLGTRRQPGSAPDPGGRRPERLNSQLRRARTCVGRSPMAHGSSASSTQRSHSSSKVVWAMSKGRPTADRTTPPIAWASSRVGWPVSTRWAERARHLARQAPHVEVVDLGHPGHRGDHRAQRVEVDVGGGRLEQHVDAGSRTRRTASTMMSTATTRAARGSRRSQRPAGDHDDRPGHQHAERGRDVGDHVEQGGPHVEVVAVLVDHEGGDARWPPWRRRPPPPRPPRRRGRGGPGDRRSPRRWPR